MWTHHHFFLYRFLPKKELQQLYFSQALRFFSLSLVALFVPLYLYRELAYSLNLTLIFFLITAVAFAFSSIFAAKFISYYGTKHSVLLSIPFILLHLLSLYLLPIFSFRWLFYLSAALAGIYLGFYWMGMHLVFLHASDHNHRGEEVGKRTAVSKLGQAFGPLFGGFIIEYIGFSLLFLIAGLLLFASALILFLSSEDYVKSNEFSLRRVFSWKRWRSAFFFLYSGSLVVGAGVIWPLFIFTTLGSYVSLGAVGTSLGVSSAVLYCVFGKWSDHNNKRKIVQRVWLFEFFSWLLRATVVTISHIFALTFFIAIIDGLLRPSVGALVYDKVDGHTLEYFVHKEIFGCFGRILALLTVLAFNSLEGGFVFSALSSLSLLFF